MRVAEPVHLGRPGAASSQESVHCADDDAGSLNGTSQRVEVTDVGGEHLDLGPQQVPGPGGIADCSVEDAADILWTYSSPELYGLLVPRSGWELARYGSFISDGLAAHLSP